MQNNRSFCIIINQSFSRSTSGSCIKNYGYFLKIDKKHSPSYPARIILLPISK